MFTLSHFYPVTLQQPSICLTSPNTGLVWGPEGAEVIRGDDFVFTCSISSHFPGGVFSLIFSDSNITETKPAVNNSASFTFPEADYEHQGNYSCVYEVVVVSRKFTSTFTAMSVTIKKAGLKLYLSKTYNWFENYPEKQIYSLGVQWAQGILRKPLLLMTPVAVRWSAT